jgi:pimeloyl-ACP methyl ester carboxylesterase
MHIKGKGPNPVPLIMTHGWPWTFWDFRKVVGPLSDPGAYGGDAADAFDVVVPSLPGFAFSSPLTQAGVFHANIADLWVKLMAALSYPRFAAQGADIGAFVTAFLGHRHPDRLIGLHLQHLVPLRQPLAAPEDYAEHERPAIAQRADFIANGSGYAAIQRTRPQTIAYGMHDSPVGLAAWLVEKRRAWADTGGAVESVFSKDDLLTMVCLYWFTETYLSSAHHYHQPSRKGAESGLIHDRLPLVEVPVAGLQFLGDIIYHPRAWAQRHYNIQQWRVEPNGGHFGVAEKPEVVVEDLRTFFRQWR